MTRAFAELLVALAPLLAAGNSLGFSLLLTLLLAIAVVPTPAAADDGFAFSPPVPPTANGAMAPGAARKQLFGSILSQLRGLMIARMAKPEVCARATCMQLYQCSVYTCALVVCMQRRCVQLLG